MINTGVKRNTINYNPKWNGPPIKEELKTVLRSQGEKKSPTFQVVGKALWRRPRRRAGLLLRKLGPLSHNPCSPVASSQASWDDSHVYKWLQFKTIYDKINLKESQKSERSHFIRVTTKDFIEGWA